MLEPIITKRLILRTLEAADADAVHAYRADPEVSRYQAWPFTSVGATRDFFAGQHGVAPFALNGWFQVGITLRETGAVVGDFGLRARDDDSRQIELGITLARPFQHRGFAAEGLSAMLGYLFSQRDPHRVYCSVDPRNQPCLRLLAKSGFRQEAHLVESLWLNGEWVDDAVFAILRREWNALRH
jgi:RimJ/RimL family protein N-acetyltransferase